MWRFRVLRSSLLRGGPLLGHQHSLPLSPSIPSFSHNNIDVNAVVTPSSLTIPASAAASFFFSFSPFPSRTYSSNSDLPSNVVLVKSDDQLNDSLQKAEDESLQAIFYFTAAWCGPCQFLWPDMKKLSENFPAVKFYKVDIDEVGAGPTISKLNIFSVPTLHFFKNGKKAAEVVGADVKRIINISSELYRDNSTM